MAWLMQKVAHRWGLRVTCAVLLVICVVISMLSTVMAQRIGNLGLVTWGLFGQYSLSLWMAIFGSGIVCSVAYVWLRRPGNTDPRWLPRTALLVFALGLAFALALAFVPLVRNMPGAKATGLLYGWAYTAILFGILLGPSLLRKPFETRAVRFIGLISYSVYIWHLVLLQRAINPALAGLSGHVTRTLVAFLIELAITLPVAYVSYQLVERPFIRARRRSH